MAEPVGKCLVRGVGCRRPALAVWDWDPETKWALSGDKPNVERVLDELALTVPDVRGELEEVAPELMHLLA